MLAGADEVAVLEAVVFGVVVGGLVVVFQVEDVVFVVVFIVVDVALVVHGQLQLSVAATPRTTMADRRKAEKCMVCNGAE